jgi:hypothetical protein
MSEKEYRDPRVFVCQGPPVCTLSVEEQVRAMQARGVGMGDGCQWCKVTTVHPDGRETVEEPGHA